MITLGIETSGRHGSVALLGDGELLGGRDLSRAGRRHARTLLAELRDLLQDADRTPRDVETIAVSIGPGSFTGLRVGVTCAKTWAYATGCHVVAVETFRAVAARSQSTTDRLEVIADAQRGELFVGRFLRREERCWQREGDIGVFGIDAWVDSLDVDAAVSGPGLDLVRERLGHRVACEPVDTCLPIAEDVARLAEVRCRDGMTDDLWQLEPLYLRKSAAEETRQLDASRP